MSAEEIHDAKVVLVGAHRDILLYQAKCPTCGKVGQPQRLHDDAQAIADRHREAGGFES